MFFLLLNVLPSNCWTFFLPTVQRSSYCSVSGCYSRNATLFIALSAAVTKCHACLLRCERLLQNVTSIALSAAVTECHVYCSVSGCYRMPHLLLCQRLLQNATSVCYSVSGCYRMPRLLLCQRLLQNATSTYCSVSGCYRMPRRSVSGNSVLNILTAVLSAAVI